MENFQDIEFDILFYLQSLHNPILDKIMVNITSLGNLGAIWFIISIVLMIIKRYRRYGVLLFVTLALTGCLGSFVIKPLIARSRPCDVFKEVDILIRHPGGFSFPSGHTYLSFAAATVICFMNKKLGILAFIFAVVMGFSRMYLFVHFPSDVVAGALLGVVVALFNISIYKALQNKGKHSRKKGARRLKR